MFRSLSLAATICLVSTAEILFHLIARPAASWLGRLEAEADPAAYRIALAAGVLLALSFVTAQALTSSSRALSTRGELDILLASPVSARNVMTARALSIAAEAVASVAILVAPVIDMNILAGRTHWLAAYAVLTGTGLFGTAIGLGLAVLLFTRMGPRRARLVSQVGAAFIGGGFVLAAQVANLLPSAWRDGMFAVLASQARTGFAHGSLLWFPVRAITGDLVSLAICLLLPASIFALMTAALGKTFGEIALAASGASAAAPRGRLRATRAFRTGVRRALRRKELLLIARDPWLVSQIFLQIVYVLPVVVILLNLSLIHI